MRDWHRTNEPPWERSSRRGVGGLLLGSMYTSLCVMDDV